MIYSGVDTKTERELQIIDAACKLIKTIGIRSMTMEDIAHEMGISKKTIYQYFTGKTELIECVVSNLFRQKKEALREARLFSSNAVEQVFLGWHALHDFLYSETNDEWQQLKKYYPHAFAIVSEFNEVFLYNYFKSNIETGITQGFYRSNIKTELIAHYLIQVILSAKITGALANGKMGFIETEDQVIAYHLHAISTEKGAKLIRKYKNELLAHTDHLK